MIRVDVSREGGRVGGRERGRDRLPNAHVYVVGCACKVSEGVC